MRTILAAGLRMPEDIALIGCGNLHYDDSLRVPLSSIDQQISQISQIGKRAREIVLAMIASKGGRKAERGLSAFPDRASSSSRVPAK